MAKKKIFLFERQLCFEEGDRFKEQVSDSESRGWVCLGDLA